jgi:hypothetical protein
MKYTLAVNFINNLYAAFTNADPESVTFQLSHKYLFILLGSACVKAAQKMLMKLTPGGVVLMFAMNESNFVVDVWETHKKYFAYLIVL